MDDRSQHILRFLRDKNLDPTTQWLNDFINQTREQTNVASLQQTALYRLLSSDLTVSAQRVSNVFPTDIASPSIMQKSIAGPVLAQLIDIENVGSSAWSQIEAIEAFEKGEMTRGHEVIRTLPNENGEIEAPRSKGPHKLLLEDAAGTQVYAFEMSPIPKIEIGCPMGTKILLRNMSVARGLIMLRPENVTILGGKIEAHDRTWQAERKQRLLQKVSQDNTQLMR